MDTRFYTTKGGAVAAIGGVAITAMAALLPLSAKEQVAVEVEQSKAVDQLKYSKMACGPTCLVNALMFGPVKRKAVYNKLPGNTGFDKMKLLTESLKTQKSAYFDGKMFDPEDGMRSRDLGVVANQLMEKYGAPKLTATYLDRDTSETGVHFLRRVCAKIENSLAAGQPVVANFETYGIDRDGEKKEGGETLWNRLTGHFVLITAIEKMENDEQLSVSIRYLDPEGGKIRVAYLYAEERRKFGARKFLTEENEPWLKGSPFLQVLAPHLTMQIGNEAWHNRTTMHFTYMVGEFAADKKPVKPAKGSVEKKK